MRDGWGLRCGQSAKFVRRAVQYTSNRTAHTHVLINGPVPYQVRDARVGTIV